MPHREAVTIFRDVAKVLDEYKNIISTEDLRKAWTVHRLDNLDQTFGIVLSHLKDFAQECIETSNNKRRPLGVKALLETPQSIVLRSPKQIVQYSKLLIVALQETLDYNPGRHHNQPPPELRLDDPEYLGDIRELVTELKRLNTLLESAKPAQAKTKQSMINISKHCGKFLEVYAPALGKGSAYLTLGVMATLLHHTGLLSDMGVVDFLSHIRLPH